MLRSVLNNTRRMFARIFLLALCLTGAVQVHAAVFSADAVKAAFLFRFASYVQWPLDVPGDGSFVIGVADGEQVAAELDALLPGMTVRGRRVEVRRVSKPEELDGVHILYVGPGTLCTHARGARARDELPILVVTDRQDGIEAGGVINFCPPGATCASRSR